MKRTTWIGVVLLVILIAVVAAFYGYNSDTGLPQSLTALGDKFTSHDGFVRYAATLRDTTCTLLLAPPHQREERDVFHWSPRQPWALRPDSPLIDLPAGFPDAVNRTLASLAGMTPTDSFVAVDVDSARYALYLRREGSPRDSSFIAAVMPPRWLHYQYLQAQAKIWPTPLGEAWRGWAGSDNAGVRMILHDGSGKTFGDGPQDRAGVEWDTVRVAYGGFMTCEVIGTISPAGKAMDRLSER